MCVRKLWNPTSSVQRFSPPSTNKAASSDTIWRTPCGGPYPSSTTNLAVTDTVLSGSVCDPPFLPENRSKERRHVEEASREGSLVTSSPDAAATTAAAERRAPPSAPRRGPRRSPPRVLFVVGFVFARDERRTTDCFFVGRTL